MITFRCTSQVSWSKVQYLDTGALIHSDTFNQWDGKRVDLIGSVSFVHDCQRHTETQPLQVTHLQQQYAFLLSLTKLEHNAIITFICSFIHLCAEYLKQLWTDQDDTF